MVLCFVFEYGNVSFRDNYCFPGSLSVVDLLNRVTQAGWGGWRAHSYLTTPQQTTSCSLSCSLLFSLVLSPTSLDLTSFDVVGFGYGYGYGHDERGWSTFVAFISSSRHDQQQQQQHGNPFTVHITDDSSHPPTEPTNQLPSIHPPTHHHHLCRATTMTTRPCYRMIARPPPTPRKMWTCSSGSAPCTSP